MDSILCFELRDVGSIPAGLTMHKYLIRRFIMRTTTVVWLTSAHLQDDLAKKQRLHDAAVNLAGESYRDELTSEINADKTELTFRRAWPDLTAAQAWVDLVLSEGAKTAQVDPE